MIHSIVRFKFWAALLVVTALDNPLAQAQTLRWNSTQSGYVYHRPSKTFRTVDGVPGSAWVGRPLVSEVEFASLSPAGNWGIASRYGSTLVFRIEEGSPVAQTEPREAIQSIQRVEWSRDGFTAVLYSGISRQIQQVRFPGAGAEFGSPVDLAFLQGQLSALAISAPGKVALAIRGGISNGVYILESGTTPVLLASVEDPRSLVFSRSGETLYAADASTESILEFRHLAPRPGHLALSAPDPVGIALSRDGRQLYFASGSGRMLSVYDLELGRLTAELPLDSNPATMDPIGDGSVFVLNHIEKQHVPLIVVDTRTGPAVYFIPASELN